MRRRLALVLFLSVFAFGCANPSAFRPAKTLGAGRFEHAFGLILSSPPSGEEGADESDLPGFGNRVPPFTPTYALRVGILDWLQIGGQVGYPFLRAEAQVHFFESTLLDLAVAGEVGYGPAPHRRIEAPDEDPFYALPFIAGLNLLPILSVVGHVGPARWDVTGWQYGGGIDLALPFVSLRPHVTVFDPFETPKGERIRRGAHTVLGFDVAFRPF